MMTSFKQKDDYLEMEIYGKVSSNQYIAVGFSVNDLMVRLSYPLVNLVSLTVQSNPFENDYHLWRETTV